MNNNYSGADDVINNFFKTEQEKLKDKLTEQVKDLFIITNTLSKPKNLKQLFEEKDPSKKAIYDRLIHEMMFQIDQQFFRENLKPKDAIKKVAESIKAICQETIEYNGLDIKVSDTKKSLSNPKDLIAQQVLNRVAFGFKEIKKNRMFNQADTFYPFNSLDQILSIANSFDTVNNLTKHEQLNYLINEYVFKDPERAVKGYIKDMLSVDKTFFDQYSDKKDFFIGINFSDGISTHIYKDIESLESKETGMDYEVVYQVSSNESIKKPILYQQKDLEENVTIDMQR